MFVLSEYTDRLPPTASRNDLKRGEETARLMGLRVFHLPQDVASAVGVEDALYLLPRQPAPTPVLWNGYIPPPGHYDMVWRVLAAKNLFLPNNADQHLRAQELHRSLDALDGLTPRTIAVHAEEELDSAAEALGFPLFLKGTVQSAKFVGVEGCLAHDRGHLHVLGGKLLACGSRTRGTLLVREFVKLRHSQTTGMGLPVGREYRCFVLGERIIGLGYYWETDDPLEGLSPSEEALVRELALEAARRMAVPYLTVDIGQLEDGRWIVIETGDGQFSGLSKIPVLEMWAALVEHSGCWLPAENR